MRFFHPAFIAFIQKLFDVKEKAGLMKRLKIYTTSQKGRQIVYENY